MDTNTTQNSAGAEGSAVTPLLTWQAPKLVRHTRTKSWYIKGGIVVIAAAAYGIISGNWSLAIIALLVGCMYFLLRDTEPPLKHISLTTHGVMFDDAFTRWEDCTGFWIVTTPECVKLHIGRKNRRQGDVIILIENVDANSVRWTLAQFLSEQTERGESALDAIIRICKL